MYIDTEAILSKLKAIKKFMKRLKKANAQVEKVDRIIEEIEELEDLLTKDEEKELKAFRLMRMLIEKLADLGDKVPLLSQFLELYIAALKSAEFFIDNILKKHSFVGVFCQVYCDVRRKREEQLRDSGMTDKDERSKNAHEFALDLLPLSYGQKQYYSNTFISQFEAEEMKRELADARDYAEKKKEDQDAPAGGGGIGTGTSTWTPQLNTADLRDFFMWLEKRIREIEEKLERGDLSDEERKKLEEELERLKKMLTNLVRLIGK